MKLRFFLLVLLFISLSACSMGEWDPHEFTQRVPESLLKKIVLVNQSRVPVFYDAWELRASHAVDPRPFFPMEAVPLPQLNPDASAEVEDIHAYDAGDDVRFFLYTIEPSDEATTHVVKFTRTLTVTHKELLQSGGRVIVEQP